MTFLLLLPALVSILVLSAHLLRGGGLLLLPLLFLMVPLLLVPRGWVARLWQLLLIAAALEWARSAVFLAAQREAEGEPWLRLVVILGGVALFNLVAAALFETEALHRTYPRRPLF